MADATTVEAHFASPSTVPVTSAGYSAAGNDVAISIGFAPPTGTSLTIVKNTGLAFISGQFTNLAHGQTVSLTHNGITYPFFANYYGGTGNDLVLEWAYRQPVSWGSNDYGQLGNGTNTRSSVPVLVNQTGVLSGKTVVAIDGTGGHGLALCSDGTVAAWGSNTNGALGNGGANNSNVPVLVDQTGVLSGKTVVAIDGGASGYSLALCADGTAAAWGRNDYGQLGNGSASDSSVPVLVNQAGVLSGNTIMAIVAGGCHSLALCADGTVAAWGCNSHGELGDGGPKHSSVPVLVNQTGVLSGKTVVAIVAGANHSLALCADGTVAAWGRNDYGQLGNGGTSDSSVPVLVNQTGALSGKTVVGVAGTYMHSFALCSDGTVAAWGRNDYGQLGNGGTSDSSVPVLVNQTGALSGRTVVAIDGGSGYSLALCSDGAVVAWGRNDYGQLGNGTTTNSSVPVAVTNTGVLFGRTFGAIATGELCNRALAAQPLSSTCTLSALSLDTGTLSPAFAFGTSTYTASVPHATNSLSISPTATDSKSSIKVNGATVTSGSASQSIPLAGDDCTVTVQVTAEDGTTKTYTVGVVWQSNDSALSNLTVNTGTLTPAFACDTTYYHASVGSSTSAITVTPTSNHPRASITVNGINTVSGSGRVVSLLTGANTIAVRVKAEDPAFATTYTLTVFRPSAVCTLSSVSLSAGTLSPTFASGTLSYTASVANVASSVQVVPTLTAATATMTVNGVAVASGGSGVSVPLAVGSNAITIFVTAQDGVTTKTYTITVTRQMDLVASFTSAGTIPATASSYNATDKRVLLSLGFAPHIGASLTLVKNTGLGFFNTRFLNLAQGQIITMAYGGQMFRFVANYYGGSGNDLVLQSADSKAYAWGANGFGQLGDGTSANSGLPLAVSVSGPLQGKVILSTAVGASHSLSLCGDGSVCAWGANIYGQLGNGTTENQSTPAAVVQTGVLNGNKRVVAVAAGYNHSLALCSDGSVAAWGFNSSGQLGNASTSNSSTPVAVKTTGTALAGKSVVGIAAGANHSLALCSDGTVVAWGNNAYGQLGNNSTANSNVAVNISTSGDLAGRTAIGFAAGSDHSLAVCLDGALLAWGRNNYGQLGNGGTTNSGVPLSVDMSDALAGKVVSSVAAGGWHGVAACSDGTLATFGRNNNGQLGNNSTADSWYPVAVVTSGALAGRTPVLSGGSNAHSLSLCSDGTLAAWGSNNNGQLGTGTTTASPVPVAVSTSTLGAGARFCGLATGSSASHVLALVATPAVQDPYQVWVATHFTDPDDQSNATVSGPSATPANDGTPNLLKYAAGVPPKGSGSIAIAYGGRVSDGPAAYLTLTFRKSKLATDVTYQAEAGDSLGPETWEPASVVVSQVDQGDHWLVTVRDSVPIGTGSSRFMRLRVTR
ncbi:MAG: cadherin-like beta sandwich domain-containing protein [Verrucomicrobia bacterium]|nr:cadherin-like beta sandwich domain-containing protein [Verrucomicrobiota bacterium]